MGCRLEFEAGAGAAAAAPAEWVHGRHHHGIHRLAAALGVWALCRRGAQESDRSAIGHYRRSSGATNVALSRVTIPGFPVLAGGDGDPIPIRSPSPVTLIGPDPQAPAVKREAEEDWGR